MKLQILTCLCALLAVALAREVEQTVAQDRSDKGGDKGIGDIKKLTKFPWGLYPIWKIHKYKGVSLRPVPIGILPPPYYPPPTYPAPPAYAAPPPYSAPPKYPAPPPYSAPPPAYDKPPYTPSLPVAPVKPYKTVSSYSAPPPSYSPAPAVSSYGSPPSYSPAPPSYDQAPAPAPLPASSNAEPTPAGPSYDQTSPSPSSSHVPVPVAPPPVYEQSLTSVPTYYQGSQPGGHGQAQAPALSSSPGVTGQDSFAFGGSHSAAAAASTYGQNYPVPVPQYGAQDSYAPSYHFQSPAPMPQMSYGPPPAPMYAPQYPQSPAPYSPPQYPAQPSYGLAPEGMNTPQMPQMSYGMVPAGPNTPQMPISPYGMASEGMSMPQMGNFAGYGSVSSQDTGGASVYAPQTSWSWSQQSTYGQSPAPPQYQDQGAAYGISQPEQSGSYGPSGTGAGAGSYSLPPAETYPEQASYEQPPPAPTY